MASTARLDMGRKPRQHGPGKPQSKPLRLADEVRRTQRRAAAHDRRIVRIAGLVLFSTETGDAWLLDPADRLAARLARDGDPEPIHVEETETAFAIAGKGHYRVEGSIFVYAERDTGRVTSVYGYPTDELTQIG